MMSWGSCGRVEEEEGDDRHSEVGVRKGKYMRSASLCSVVVAVAVPPGEPEGEEGEDVDVVVEEAAVVGFGNGR